MTIKIEPGISLDKTKIKKEAKEGEPEASEGRDELVTPEPTGEDGDAVVLDGDDHQGRDNPASTIEITKVSGADDRVKKSEEKKELGQGEGVQEQIIRKQGADKWGGRRAVHPAGRRSGEDQRRGGEEAA